MNPRLDDGDYFIVTKSGVNTIKSWLTKSNIPISDYKGAIFIAYYKNNYHVREILGVAKDLVNIDKRTVTVNNVDILAKQNCYFKTYNYLPLAALDNDKNFTLKDTDVLLKSNCHIVLAQTSNLIGQAKFVFWNSSKKKFIFRRI